MKFELLLHKKFKNFFQKATTALVKGLRFDQDGRLLKSIVFIQTQVRKWIVRRRLKNKKKKKGGKKGGKKGKK
jgi:hypothetical protein